MILVYTKGVYSQYNQYYGLGYIDSVNTLSTTIIPPIPYPPIPEPVEPPDPTIPTPPEIVTKFSDYVVHSVEYFISQLNTELAYRDIQGLSNNTIELINISKQHPLVSLMKSTLSETSTNVLRAGIIPAISVTPGGLVTEGFTLAQSYQPEIVNDAFIADLTEYLNKTNKEKQQDVLLTERQIETIIGEYNRVPAGTLRVQGNEWHKNEDINISVWSNSPDIDILLSNLMDSILATMQVGFIGDYSIMRYMRYKINKGLTNFQYGRTLFGTEYNVTFFNSFKNYIVYKDEVLSGFDFYGIMNTPGQYDSDYFRTALGTSDNTATINDDTVTATESPNTSTIITKFSDYIINSVEYFITQIENELEYRDIQGLSNGTIDLINVTKQHPIVSLMSATVDPNSNVDDLRANIIPAISVSPGNLSDKGFTIGQTLKTEIVDDDFIDELKVFLAKTNKQIQDDMLITHAQIETIIGEYNRTEAGGMRVQHNEFFKNEEINVAVWSNSPDVDILLSNLMDSMLSSIQVGFAGDGSPLRDFEYKTNKGLTNFNFGRTLFGTEYNLTFLNSFNNFIIYTDDVLSGHDLIGTFEIPGEEE